jgi:hypothetical protein
VADDVFVLRRVAPGRFVHLGGKGRGEGWAGIVEATVEEDAAVAQALRSGKPVRVGSAEGERVFGPYYAREAAIVPLSQDTIVVLGAPNGGLEGNDHALLAEAKAADELLAPVGKPKQLADELELLEAVRSAVAVSPSPLDEAMAALAGIAAEALSCELGLLYLADGDRLGVAERGWELKVPRDEVVTSLRNVLVHGAFPFCVQDAHTAPPPGTIAKDKGIRSYYLLELTGLACRVLLVAHTDAAPRGFTLLCRRLGARVAEVASTVLGVGLTREWTGAEAVRLQTVFAELER